MKSVMRIEIVSDQVCPWCFIGKRRLEAALSQRPDIEVKIVWQPYQLSPDMPREGRNKLQHYQQIFGEERATKIMSSMRDTGVAEGIQFGSSPDAVSPNTLSAHVLMLWAQEDSSIDSNLLAEKLFEAHHVNCEDIGNAEVLTRIGSELGMDPEVVLKKLTSGEDEDHVKGLIRYSADRGVSGVPFFIINDRYGMSGAQPPEVFLEAIDQIQNAGESAEAD